MPVLSSVMPRQSDKVASWWIVWNEFFKMEICNTPMVEGTHKVPSDSKRFGKFRLLLILAVAEILYKWLKSRSNRWNSPSKRVNQNPSNVL